METDSIYSIPAGSLAAMMDADSAGSELWSLEELGEILEHQLSAPIEFDLDRPDCGLSGRVGAIAAAAVPPIKTFRDLFAHPHPPAELLESVKRFSKQCRTRPESPLPGEVSTVLYFLSIVIALQRCSRRITGLNDEALRNGLEWVSMQSWIAPSTKKLFGETGGIALSAQVKPPEPTD
jgi:hypothetical protein